MAIEKVCDICGATGAQTVEVQIVSVNSSLASVGTAQAKDLCAAHRSQGITSMLAQTHADIEVAIAA